MKSDDPEVLKRRIEILTNQVNALTQHNNHLVEQHEILAQANSNLYSKYMASEEACYYLQSQLEWMNNNSSSKFGPRREATPHHMLQFGMPIAREKSVQTSWKKFQHNKSTQTDKIMVKQLKRIHQENKRNRKLQRLAGSSSQDDVSACTSSDYTGTGSDYSGEETFFNNNLDHSSNQKQCNTNIENVPQHKQQPEASFAIKEFKINKKKKSCAEASTQAVLSCVDAKTKQQLHATAVPNRPTSESTSPVRAQNSAASSAPVVSHKTGTTVGQKDRQSKSGLPKGTKNMLPSNVWFDRNGVCNVDKDDSDKDLKYMPGRVASLSSAFSSQTNKTESANTASQSQSVRKDSDLPANAVDPHVQDPPKRESEREVTDVPASAKRKKKKKKNKNKNKSQSTGDDDLSSQKDDTTADNVLADAIADANKQKLDHMIEYMAQLLKHIGGDGVTKTATKFIAGFAKHHIDQIEPPLLVFEHERVRNDIKNLLMETEETIHVGRPKIQFSELAHHIACNYSTAIFQSALSTLDKRLFSSGKHCDGTRNNSVQNIQREAAILAFDVLTTIFKHHPDISFETFDICCKASWIQIVKQNIQSIGESPIRKKLGKKFIHEVVESISKHNNQLAIFIKTYLYEEGTRILDLTKTK